MLLTVSFGLKNMEFFSPDNLLHLNIRPHEQVIFYVLIVFHFHPGLSTISFAWNWVDELYKIDLMSLKALKSLWSYYFLKEKPALPNHGSKEPANFFNDLTPAEDTGNFENHALFYVEFILIKHKLRLSCSAATWRSQRAKKALMSQALQILGEFRVVSLLSL